jgi:LPXTG-site transpeptidase (sortase) family protein
MVQDYEQNLKHHSSKRDLDLRAPNTVVQPPTASRSELDPTPYRSFWSRYSKFKFTHVRPKLVLHPLTLGILTGVIAIFALAVVVPRLGAKIVVMPKLAPSSSQTAATSVVTTPPPSAALSSVLAAKVTDRLAIPVLGINAPVISLGLISGALDTPKTLWQVGRYNAGSNAGSLGTTIIVGHSGAPGQVGVFEHLNIVKVGDLIAYKYADGRSFTYKVISSKAYPETTATAVTLFHQTANPTLNLVSCFGQWDAKTSDYNERWIITSQLIST